MKKKVSKNTNGIIICDSIVMSVKKKRPDLRSLEAVIIAIIGYVSAVMSFLTMFDFNYSRIAVMFSAFTFSAVYITLALIGKKGVWIAAGSVIPALLFAVRIIDHISLGYKYMYNIVYKSAFHTQISYYKHLKPNLERISVTAFFIFALWVLAIVIYIFTIYRPNSIPPLIVTFPLIEIGLYNGIKLSIFWGILLVAYWLALFAMTATDIGEYSGGNSGFVRKGNLFFPKRQMRLKVTEKCGLIIIAEVIAVAVFSTVFLRLIHYQRSDAINQKRIAVREAVNSFSVDNLAESVSNITSAFGLDFEYESHQLGNVDKLRYKDVTDLTVKLDRPFSSALYLKDYTGSVYDTNKWDALPGTAYQDFVFDQFYMYDMYPQLFPNTFDSVIYPSLSANITITSKQKKPRSLAPYGTSNEGIVSYKHDSDVSSMKSGQKEFSYSFSLVNCAEAENILRDQRRSIIYKDLISEGEWNDKINQYFKGKKSENDETIGLDTELNIESDALYDNPEVIFTELLQNDYEDFVYANYLDYPDTSDLEEVRKSVAGTLGKSTDLTDLRAAELLNDKNSGKTARNMTAKDKIAIMNALRSEVASRVEYSLTPGRTPGSRDFINYFLLENKKGYCTHYASTGVILARMAGIPARYATGYVVVGDDFSQENKNNAGGYTIDVKDNRSHAWVEIYLNGYGWVPFEFTAGYSDSSIDTTPTTTTTGTTTSLEATTTTTAAETESEPTTSRPQQQGSTTTTAATTAPPVVSSNNGTGSSVPAKPGAERGFHIPQEAKFVLFPLFILAAAIAAVMIRRKLILRSRSKHFTQGGSAKQMRYIYGFAEKLLKLTGIERGEASLTDFAASVDSKLGGKLYSAGAFSKCTDSALRAAFSADLPDSKDIEQSIQFTEQLAKSIYDRSGRIRKIYLRFIIAII